MSFAIKTENLSFSYQRELILENVTLTVNTGEFVGLIGPNGGGKTTLLSLFMGFLKPTSGTLSIFGKPVKGARTSIGWVPQHFNYDKSFPISSLEVVLTGRLSQAPFFGGYSKGDKETAVAALEKVGMERYKNTPFSELSGGQAQRVLLARALVNNPTLLFLDEPTANVDPRAQGEIYAALLALKGMMTIVMVTHDLKIVESHIEKVFCVQREVFPLSAKEVCQHFALGLYHGPLKEKQL